MIVLQEIITTPNQWRALMLADLIERERVMVRSTWTTKSGHVESVCSVHPEFQGTLYHQFAYPKDVKATLEALALKLHEDRELRERAERQGITEEGIQEMIESGENAD